MDFDWKTIVKNVAPILGMALGGPLAGTAVKVLAEGLLGNPNATEQEVAEAVMGASPDQLIKMRELNQTFQVKMKELGIDVYRLEVDDRKSARDLAKVNFWPQITLSVLYSGGYFAVLFQFVTGTVLVSAQSESIFSALIGVMTAAQIQIMNFWFGSSFGSKEKTAVMSHPER